MCEHIDLGGNWVYMPYPLTGLKCRIITFSLLVVTAALKFRTGGAAQRDRDWENGHRVSKESVKESCNSSDSLTS